MQMKKQLKRILAFVMAFTFIVSTQVHAADGESSALMDIKSDGYEIQIADSASITYTGKEVTPAIKVVRTDESKEETVLDENKYETAYSDNVNAGTAKVTVKGKENEGVTGELTKEFTISPASLKDAAVTVANKSATYTGTAVKPAVTVELGGKVLKENTDYKVSYANNKNVGTAEITVTGIGNYTDTAKATFSIVVGTSDIKTSSVYNKVSLSWGKVTGASGYKIYRSTSKDSGYKAIKTVKSGATVNYNDTKVTFNQTYYYKVRAYRIVGDKAVFGEYSPVSKQKVKVGTSSVKRTASASTTSYNAVTVKWSKVNGANGYKVYRSTSVNGTYKALKVVANATSYTDKTTTCGTTYYYKVRAYRLSGKTKCYGDLSKAKSGRALPGTTTIKASSECFQTKVNLKWVKVYGASGYEIYRSTSKSGKYTLVKNIKSGRTVKWTNSGLKKGQYYYYKIRAYRTVDGKKLYGGYSNRFRKGTAGWKYINGLKLYYDAQGKLVKDVSKIIGKQSSYVIKVNKKMNVVTVYAKDGDNGYIIPVKSFVCSGGAATPVGTFYTPAKYRWQTLMGPCYGQWCTRIHGGVLFHSVFYSTRSNSTLSVNAYNKLGTTCSHGCVRLRVGDAKWIYDNCRLRTKVIIYNSSSVGPFGKPKAAKLASWHTWDPTDPTARSKCKARGCH